MSSEEECISFLINLGAAQVPHSKGTLLLHLLGTSAILRAWRANNSLCLAGLFHSVYGTPSFEGLFRADDKNRSLVRNIIGENAEELVHVYSYTTLNIVQNALAFYRKRNDESTTNYVDILNLIVANEIEQATRTSSSISLQFLDICVSLKHYLLPQAVLSLSLS